MKENAKVKKLVKHIEKAAYDEPEENELDEGADFSYDRQKGGSEAEEMVDFVVTNPDYAMVRYAGNEFLLFWKNEAAAMKKLQGLLDKLERRLNKG